MFDWLIHNKEWFLSGIGVLMISTISALLTKKYKNHEISPSLVHQSSGDNSTNIQAHGNITIENIHTQLTVNEDKNKIQKSTIQVEKIEKQNIEVTIKEGSFIDIPWKHAPYRISLKRIVLEEFNLKFGGTQEEGVELYIDNGGGLVYGGEYAKNSGVNQWIIPLNKFTEETPFSIYSHFVYKGSLSFFRCYVSHINMHDREATLNIYIVDVPNSNA